MPDAGRWQSSHVLWVGLALMSFLLLVGRKYALFKKQRLLLLFWFIKVIHIHGTFGNEETVWRQKKTLPSRTLSMFFCVWGVSFKTAVTLCALFVNCF